MEEEEEEEQKERRGWPGSERSWRAANLSLTPALPASLTLAPGIMPGELFLPAD